MPADRSDLGAFLRSRRDRLTPAQAGITAFPGPRRVPGLRKEELALIAGLSPDHYSRLEQGRQSTVTDDVVEALSRALRLDAVESAHLRDLAAPMRRRRTAGREAPQRAEPGLLRMMGTVDHVPALVMGRRSEVLATNALLQAVLGAEVVPGVLFVRWLYLDPRARERIVNWDHYARATAGSLRYELGRHPDDVRLVRLVAELRASGGGQFDRWWDEHGVVDVTSVPKQIAHPALGPLSFDLEMVTPPHEPDQRLIVYTVEPDSATARALPLVRAWGIDRAPVLAP